MNNAVSRINDRNPVASLFEEHDVTITNMTPEAFRDALVQNCETVMPTLKTVANRSTERGLCELALLQASDNPLEADRRECLLVVGTGRDNQIVALFKWLEYQRRWSISLPLCRQPNEWIPLHPSRMQMADMQQSRVQNGVRMVTERIQAAVQSAH